MPKLDTASTQAADRWRRYCRITLCALAAELLIVCAVIAVGNPYGNLPHLVFNAHVIMDTNQRYQYPAIARSGQFDSIVIGTSTSRLLRPAALDHLFGGHFANLAMDAATAWEQYRLATFFAAHTRRPRTLLVGLDHVWCKGDADTAKTTFRGFPKWMYDDDPWNDLVWMLNKRSLEISGRRIGNALGLNPARIPFDGYEVFTPPESQYDLRKVERKIYGAKGPPIETASIERAPYVPTEAERASWRYPALDWLATFLSSSQRWQRVVFVFTPPHVSALPARGSRAKAQFDECKARIARLARQHGAPVIDFHIVSPITTVTENYWDRLHYRVPIAVRLVAEIKTALATGADDPAGDWKVLAPPRPTALGSAQLDTLSADLNPRNHLRRSPSPR